MSEITEHLKTGADGQELDWVKVEGQKRFNISRRQWTEEKNLSIEPGETYVVPRNANGMKFYFRNEEYFKILETEPELDVKESGGRESEPEMFECGDCGREFDTERGLKQHRTKSHEDNKNEDEEE